MATNSPAVSGIKREAVSSGLREAFLESAPQLILQISIVLKTGILSEILFPGTDAVKKFCNNCTLQQNENIVCMTSLSFRVE